MEPSRPLRLSLASLALASLASPSAWAEGFRSPTTGTSGLAATGGRIAFVDDASANFHNPANLTELTLWEVSAEPTFVYHSVRYDSPSGNHARTENPWKILPHLFLGGPLPDHPNIALGLGVSVPYGLSIDWEPNGDFQYSAPHYVELKTFNFNPNIAVRVVDNLSLAVGFDLMYSELTLKQYVPWSATLGIPGLPDGEFIAEGDGVGLSANAAVTWDFLEHHRLAFTARLPMDVRYEGDFRATNIPLSPSGQLTAPFKSEIRFPTVLALGYGFAATETLRFEANVEWLQFSRFENLPTEIDTPLPLLPTEVPQNWDDTFTAGLSATWDASDAWRLQASYQYFDSPVPEETFSPSIPDSQQHALSAGVRYRRGPHRLGLAYSYVFYEDRSITQNLNPAYLGEYSFNVHLLSAGYGFSF